MYIKDLKRMLIIGSIVSISMPFSLKFFTEGFIITISVVVLSILLYINNDLNPLYTSLITGIMSPVFRMVLLWIKLLNTRLTFRLVSPDIIFYISYGIIFYFFYYVKKPKDLSRFAATVLLCDFASNIVEMSFRKGVIVLDQSIIKTLFAIAVIRTIIVVSAIMLLKTYKSFLVKQEHEKRYKKLVMLTSVFESETYFMNKNMQYIENIMKKIFMAHRMSIERELPGEFQDIVLDIAKDIHEIKKEYLMVLRGLEQIFTNKFKNEKMHIKDIMNILQINMGEYVKALDTDVEINYRIKSDIIVKDHYYLMSIIRNLINNSIEATKEIDNAKIDVSIEDEVDSMIIKIRDNGNGIKESHRDFIFKQGFSTKFNETGDINRGLGLTIVSHLIKDIFNGSIDFKSAIGKGTEFIIYLNKNLLEGEDNENIHS